MSKSKIFTSFLFLSAGVVIGMGLNNFAMSDNVNTNGIKIAVVDVNKVVANSKQVSDLKKQQEIKANELSKWLETVKTDIQKQTTDEGKATIAKKYDAELVKKQNANRVEYQKKLNAIDTSISNTIQENAKALGYDIVFSKSAVLYGGNDITSAISRAVK